MRIISIANQKGGCGKTTTAINVAASLALEGRRVLLIDLDPQSHASLGLNIESDESIYNVISRLTPRKLNIKNIIKNISRGFDIVPSNVLVGTLEQELADEIGRELKLSLALEPIKDDYDYIIIDCPPSLGFLTVNALRASDEVIVPVEPSRFSMQGVERLVDIINLIKDRLNHSLEWRVLITIFDSRLRHSFSMLSKIRDKFGDRVFSAMIHVNVKLKESVVMGKTVVSYDKYCRGAKDYFGLARDLLLLEEDKTGVFEPLSLTMRSLIKENAEQIKPIQFCLDDPNAESVYVTGSFNKWSLDESYRMEKNNGKWSIDLPLNPGVYEYRFIIDGRWEEDPKNPNRRLNSFGAVDSLIEVK